MKISPPKRRARPVPGIPFSMLVPGNSSFPKALRGRHRYSDAATCPTAVDPQRNVCKHRADPGCTDTHAGRPAVDFNLGRLLPRLLQASLTALLVLRNTFSL